MRKQFLFHRAGKPVQRYIGSEGSSPRLDRLGGKSWETRKGKVKKAAEDIAEKLIAIYSRRRHASVCFSERL
jgi:transcription-repair coupling factor (superfamily II helicase)